jgi:hypothetical protein
MLAAGMVLSISAAACGDDDTDEPTSGSGGSGGTGGKAGSSGSGGKAGSSGSGGAGGSVSATTCESDTKTATMTSFTPACYTCLCKETADRGVIEACNKASMSTCWGLIQCVGAKCAGTSGAAQTTCATNMCGPYLAAAGTATPAGAILTSKCSDTCIAATLDDGGTDAGQ